MKMILLGAPGAGKGTQADFITTALQIPVISTGNLLREATAQGTELGKAAQDYMSRGALVPDELIIGLVKEKLASPDCANGAILDGFPRTVPQAEALDEIVDLDVALYFDVPDAVIVERMAGRRTCPKCSATYHVTNNPPATEGVCDKCGETLGIRRDDAPEVVQPRLQVYHDQTEPVMHHYAAKGKLVTVQGVGTVAEIRQRIADALKIEA